MIFALTVVTIIILIWVFYSLNQPPLNTKLYFDHAATTFPTPRALDTYRKFSRYGNLSQIYNRNLQGKIAEMNAYILGYFYSEGLLREATLLWTSGGSEGNNTVFNAIADYTTDTGSPAVILVGDTEHHTSYSCLRKLAAHNRIVWDTFSSLSDLALKLQAVPNVRLVSLMHVNNETGQVYDLVAVRDLVRQISPNTLVHSDVVQSLGKRELPQDLDFYTGSAHKFGGVTGVGLLACSNRGARVIAQNPLITGTQQNDMRGGTFNIAGAVSTYQALLISIERAKETLLRTFNIRTRAVEIFSEYFPVTTTDKYRGVDEKFGFAVTGNDSRGLAPTEICVFQADNQAPNILAFSVVKYCAYNQHFCNLELKEYCLKHGIIIATGSACSKGKSEVLINMGMPFIIRCGFIRLSFNGETNTKDLKQLMRVLLRGIQKQL